MFWIYAIFKNKKHKQSLKKYTLLVNQFLIELQYVHTYTVVQLGRKFFLPLSPRQASHFAGIFDVI